MILEEIDNMINVLNQQQLELEIKLNVLLDLRQRSSSNVKNDEHCLHGKIVIQKPSTEKSREERKQKIIEYLRQKGKPMRYGTICRAIGIPLGSFHHLMKDDDRFVKVGQGIYTLSGV